MSDEIEEAETDNPVDQENNQDSLESVKRSSNMLLRRLPTSGHGPQRKGLR